MTFQTVKPIALGTCRVKSSYIQQKFPFILQSSSVIKLTQTSLSSISITNGNKGYLVNELITQHQGLWLLFEL